MLRSTAPLVTILILASAHADWPHWRGPTRNSISPEDSGWDGSTWLAEPLWQAFVGEGSSSPVVVDDRVYLMGWSNEQDTVYCFDAASGKAIWSESYKSPRYGRYSVGDKGLYSGTCSTPEYDADTGLLFTLGIDGHLNAWDTGRRGKLAWSINLYQRFGALRRPEVAKRKKTRRDYGYVSSPLVVGNELIVETGGEQENLVALDKRTGRFLWESENRDEAGHTGGPVPIMVEGIPCVAVLTLRNLVVTRIDGANAGKTVAEYPWTTDFGNNIATPSVFGDSVIITSAYNHYAMCRLKITLGGAVKVWESKVASGVCSPLVHDGHVYWAWRGVHCVDFATGEEKWVGGKVGAEGSCILTSDDRLIVYANRGDLTLVETARKSPNKYSELASKQVLAETEAWPHVVFCDGRLLCRDRAGNVRCLAVASRGHGPGLKRDR